jgi:putative ABC transport system substrate-binding protein
MLLGGSEDDPQTKAGLAAFEKALRELGWQDGRNIRIDYRWAAADVDRMRTFAKELINLQPDVVVAHTTPVVAALQRETRTIPIVLLIVSDPVGSGFVATLRHPGGNITGFINIESSLAGKWIELLKEIVPRLARAAILFNPIQPRMPIIFLFSASSVTLGLGTGNDICLPASIISSSRGSSITNRPGWRMRPAIRAASSPDPQ